MVVMGMLAAVIVVLTQISIPLPGGVPVTLQTLAVALCGYMLGAKLGTMTVAIYIALGGIGLPVFSGFLGGVGRLAGPTGGYIYGFLFMALLCGIGVRFSQRVVSICFGILGIAACHIPGVVQFAIVTNRTIQEAFFVASAPFLIKDVISVILAYSIAFVLVKSLKRANLVFVESDTKIIDKN